MIGHGKLDEEVLIVNICREMKWTYQEFLEQPAWFVELLVEIINLEEKEKERRIKIEELKAKTKSF